MGMSASQARLLSITSRVTNNEFRAQTITNSKLRLAEKSEEASAEYMEALNSKKLMYGIYDDNGDRTYTDLTANVLLSYGDLKNQYSLVNSCNQIMLSGADIKKYEASTNLHDYLYSYGIEKVDNPKYDEKLKEILGPKYEELFGSAEYDADPDATKAKWPDYFDGLTNEGIEDLRNMLSLPIGDLANSDPANTLKTIVLGWAGGLDTTVKGLRANHDLEKSDLGVYLDTLLNYPNLEFPDADSDEFFDKSGNSELANKYDIASKKCYNNAHPPYNGTGQNCFLHVLAHLLLSTDTTFLNGMSNYHGTTTTGKTCNVDYVYGITTSAIHGNGQTHNMVEVSNEINKLDADGNPVYYAPKDKSDTTTASSSEKDKLLSNYKWVGGEKVLKSWTERIVDLYYACANKSSLGIDYESELLPFLDKFQTDMENELSNVFNEERYNQAVEQWRATISLWLDTIEAVAEEFRNSFDSVPERKLPDETDAKYQWYVNLWNRMGCGAENADGSKNNANYKEIDENLINNPEWLEFCFEHGVLTMEQAKFTDNGSITYPGMGNYDWVPTIYTSAADVISQDDEIAIAIAEVKYKKTITEIENKDKKFDQDLKKLDSEHSALEAEYESIKEVISKNVDRTFKAFS